VRQRTAKTLGTRHDLNYFKHFTAFRFWRLFLALAIPIAAVLWLGSASGRKQTIYSKGPLSSAHAFFAEQCSLCHSAVVGGIRMAGFKKTVTDEVCLSCHQAPPHQANQPFTPTCGSCHVEHQGLVRLSHVPDAQCVQCHGDLLTRDGRLQFVANIRGFNRNHPEFAPVRDPALSTASITIAFNHARHLGESIMAPSGRVKLECEDCHRPAMEAAGPWKYGDGSVQLISPPKDAGEALRLGMGRELMGRVTYEQHCASCHLLQFDDRMTGPFPHKTPDVVHAFVVQQFQDYISRHPEEVRKPQVVNWRVPGMTLMPSTTPKNASEWVEQRVAETEQILWHETCKKCHQLEFPAGTDALPRVKPSVLPARWLPNAIFSHEAHTVVACDSCHAYTRTSQKSSEILIPSIKSCQSCHNGNPAKSGNAENSCFLCHSYHKWKQSVEFHSKYSIDELTGSTALKTSTEPADHTQ
jgi:hypothetical protein